MTMRTEGRDLQSQGAVMTGRIPTSTALPTVGMRMMTDIALTIPLAARGILTNEITMSLPHDAVMTGMRIRHRPEIITSPLVTEIVIEDMATRMAAMPHRLCVIEGQPSLRLCRFKARTCGRRPRKVGCGAFRSSGRETQKYLR